VLWLLAPPTYNSALIPDSSTASRVGSIEGLLEPRDVLESGKMGFFLLFLPLLYTPLSLTNYA